ncbi:ATP-dependent RNA helicase HrpB [Methylobrevis pamukkalensis]|uniref:ATP-dependent RNA helicase HrpB n=1 Tax=Methylobrevis pamukkalensis TaxID=1439726 RepID=A0A1E3H7G4_9HYPH|nr:ATP-dependent RNA helicase HrpB [Methylobrevis pamukkalensis]
MAQARGARGAFRLANGRGGLLDETHPLAGAGFLVVADLTGRAENARIRLAAAIDGDEVEEIFASAIETADTLAFDAPSRSVRARRVRRLGALVLSESVASTPDPAAVASLLAEHAARIGIDRLPWTKDQRALRARATFLYGTLGAPWPDLSEAALGQTAADWLAPQISGTSRLDAIDADALGRALDLLLPWSLRAEMERLLPSHFDAPSGSRLPIDYGAENGPALEVRVQELFGLDRHPAVAGGRVPLLLVLLSPAHRPIQTTRDLPGFWRGSWKDVAKDLKGRYPRHAWPEDPLAATATARAKPRGT